MISDRIKQSLLDFIRSALAGVDYLGKYDAKVVSQSADGTKVDVQPFDPRLSGMKNIALRNGLPETVCKVSPGALVLIGWDGGDPRKPYAVAGWKDATVTTIEVGGASAQFVAQAPKVKAWFDAFNAAVTGWTPVPNDGGAALKTALTTLIGGVPSTDPACQKFKTS